MSVTKNFEKLLKKFFEFYHPRQVKKVGKIVQEFKGQEIMLLKVLCDKYKKAYTVIPGLNEELNELFADPTELETNDESLTDESTEEENQVTEEIVSEEKEEELVTEAEEEGEEEVVTETNEEEEEK